MSSTTDKVIINSVPKFLFSSLSRSITPNNISVNNLPTSYVIKKNFFFNSITYIFKSILKLITYGKRVLKTTNLTTITDLNLLAIILPSITKSDISSITDDCKRVTTIINLLNASLTYNIQIKSNQVNFITIYNLNC